MNISAQHFDYFWFQYENIAKELYDMPWYRLPNSYQRWIYCGIQDIQNGAVLKMGSFCKIDFQLAAKVSTHNNEEIMRSYLNFCLQETP